MTKSSKEIAIELLRSLIGFASVSSQSNAEVSQFIAATAESFGLSVDIQSYVDPNGVQKCNVIGHHRGSSSQTGGLAYFSHSDVVPATSWTGPEGDPFIAQQLDDRIYGRGACDMKGSVAAMLAAINSVDLASCDAPIWFVCTADEEVGFEGVRQFVEKHSAFEEIVADQPLTIIGEPTSLRPVRAHKGIVAFRFEAMGRAAHSGTDLGINANRAMVPLMQRFGEIEKRCREEQALHDNVFDPCHLSFNFGISDGMRAINITPARSTAWASWRPMPGSDGVWIEDTLRQVCQENGITIREVSRGGPLVTDESNPEIQSLVKMTGQSPLTVAYGTDGGELNLLENRVVLGPGSIDQAHTADEFITIEQLSKGVDLYRTLIESR
ncbi:MAG: M20 family metallopeptidase [Planctomycetota bacterium]